MRRTIARSRVFIRPATATRIVFRRLLCVIGTIIVVAWCHPGDADDDDRPLQPLLDLIGQLDDPAVQLDLLKGMRDGLRGRKQVAMPANWPGLYRKLSASPNADVREHASLIGLIFGDSQVHRDLRATLLNRQAPVPERLTALQALVEKRVAGLATDLHRLLDEKPLRRAAIRALAAYNDHNTPVIVLDQYGDFDAAERQDAISMLAARPTYALALLSAVEQQIVRRSEISAFTARQLRTHRDARINDSLRKVWGEVRDTSQNKAALMSKVKATLTPKTLAQADLANGRAIYRQTCAKCHHLFDDGGRIGPELTGSQRANLDYILENVVDPNAVIGKDYQLVNVTTVDGRVLSGIVVAESTRTLTVQTSDERVVLDRGDVNEMVELEVSMMPEGQLDMLTDEQIRDLVAYLAAPAQVPLPPGNE